VSESFSDTTIIRRLESNPLSLSIIVTGTLVGDGRIPNTCAEWLRITN
jgi:hypothetical protein